MTSWYAISVVALLGANAIARAPASKASPSRTYESVTTDANGNLQIVTANHRTITIRRAEGQTRFEDLSIASDHTAVGALNDYDNPTPGSRSYDLPLGLTVYANGKIHVFDGHGLMVAKHWHFVDGGRRVAYGVTTVHGNCSVNWELWEISSKRLVADATDKRDCDPTDSQASSRPIWIDGDTSGLK
jgi:hypothetical protein